jgi:hypothetical protein
MVFLILIEWSGYDNEKGPRLQQQDDDDEYGWIVQMG